MMRRLERIERFRRLRRAGCGIMPATLQRHQTVASVA